MPKLHAHFAGNERFVPEFPSSLLSGYALNKQTGHSLGRNLGTRLIFSPPRVVRSEQCTILAPSPQRHQACFFDLTDFSTVFLGFYGVNFLCFGGNRINIYGVSTDKARRKYVHNFRGNSQFSFLTRITLIYE